MDGRSCTAWELAFTVLLAPLKAPKEGNETTVHKIPFARLAWAKFIPLWSHLREHNDHKIDGTIGADKNYLVADCGVGVGSLLGTWENETA